MEPDSNTFHANIMARFSQPSPFLAKIIVSVEENLSNEQFGVEELALSVNMNRTQLYRRIKKLTNKTVSQFIREIRLNKGMELLQKHEYTASEIAYQVGFGSPTYFNKCFHDYFGFPPGQIRRKYNEIQV